MADLTTLLSKFLTDLYAGSFTLTGNVTAARVFGASSATLPAFSITGDTNTGSGASAADTFAIWAGGTTPILTTTASAVTSTVPYVGPTGSAAATSFNFGTPGTGMFGGATSGALAASGVNRFVWDTSGAYVNTLFFDITNADASLFRGAAGRIDTTKAFRMTPVAFASLPTAAEGAIAWVNNSTTATWGATIAGGGANKVLAVYNGTNWTVAGV